ncbi:MAG: thiol reductant ABC exporter subunit CydD [Anaerolineales bacterium]|nr:thiol reductant ABC exporter subunit CydD [Anaerolineales bacterium]
MNLDKRLLDLIRSTRLAFYLTIFIGLLAGICTVLQARTLSSVVTLVFLQGGKLVDVAISVQVLLILIVVRATLVWSGELSANRVATSVKVDLRERLYKHFQSLGPSELQSQHKFSTGEVTNIITEGVESLDSYYRQYLPQLVLAAILPLTYLIFVLQVDKLSGFILLFTAPLIPIFMILIGSKAASLTKRQWHTLSQMSAYFLDVLQGITTLKLFDRSRAQIKVIGVVSERYRHTTLGILRVTFLSALVLEMVSTLSTAIVAVEIGLRLLSGHFTFEQAFFVLLLAPEFYLPLRMLGIRFHAGTTGVDAANRIFEVFETDKSRSSIPVVVDEHKIPPTLHTKTTTFTKIQFDNVYCVFRDQRTALNGITFDINSGESTALVGPSGAGKTTVVQLLLRFLEPTQGEITLDGTSLPQIPTNEWRHTISWVPQNPYLFNDTVVANIRLGRQEASLTAVREAAKNAYAHNFIENLPHGYDTIIGERGLYLIGGQAQRIALARAFLKDAPFLILDEATANLDPETALKIQKAITYLMKGRTTLLIAHRLHTVSQANKIIVLDSGRIVESGSHKTLSQQGGLYQHLVTAYGGNP